jgi:ribonucleoside-diphosphate reductase alpha chain
MSDRKEVFDKTLDYFNGDNLAADVFLKYALRDGENFLETSPDQMHRRLAKEFARIESSYPNPMDEEEIYCLLKDFQHIIPQGSPMSGIGNTNQVQSLSNCFVVDSAHDSYGGILFADQEQVQIMKRRGGVGHDVSTIRPRGMPTKNAAMTTDGIAVFMDRFSNSCREVAQGGRRGALMLTIDCRHPEIMTFLNIKRDKKRVTGANISVKWHDDFMQAVVEGHDYDLRWPVDCSTNEASVIETVNAREVWEAFVDAAWSSAEPGALFWSTALRNSPADIYSKYGFASTSTNPCGEIILSPYDSCRLMVVNLKTFVKNPFLHTAEFDFEKFKSVTSKAQRLMDDMIDLEVESIDRILEKIKNDLEPDPIKLIEKDLWLKIRATCLKGRRTGLGITALGDTLAALSLRYGSDESIEMTEMIYKALAVSSHSESVRLAAERGCFSVWDYELEKDHTYLNRILSECDIEISEMYRATGRRNIANTTTAPVGSVSCLTQTTSGIEPAYLLSYKRRRKVTSDLEKVDFVDELGDRWQMYDVFHPGVAEWMHITGETDISKSPYHKATSADINWGKSVELQAAAQKWVDHSISKTCNLPKDATRETVADVYMKAWLTGCKGFTVYRDGCRDGVLVSADATSQDSTSIVGRSAPKRPEFVECEIHRANISGEAWIIFVGIKDGIPFEIFGGLSELVEIPRKYKEGRIRKRVRKTVESKYDLVLDRDDDELVINDIVRVFANPNHTAFTRTISLSLRHNVPVQFIVEQLLKDKDADLFSFSKVIARCLKKYIADGTKVSNGVIDTACCDNPNIVYQEGCATCLNCGFAKCG